MGSSDRLFDSLLFLLDSLHIIFGLYLIIYFFSLQFVEPEAGEKRHHSDEEEDRVWESMVTVADKNNTKKKSVPKRKKIK